MYVKNILSKPRDENETKKAYIKVLTQKPKYTNQHSKATFNNETLVLNGKRLGDTKWKRWAWNFVLLDMSKKII
jgi:hypothetical protein